MLHMAILKFLLLKVINGTKFDNLQFLIFIYIPFKKFKVMTKLNSILMLIIMSFGWFSCVKDNECDECKQCEECEDKIVYIDSTAGPQIDFVYSIADKGTYAEVCASSACNYVPSDAVYSWNFNGGRYYDLGNVLSTCAEYTSRGKFSISLVVTVPSGLQYSKAKEFDVDF